MCIGVCPHICTCMPTIYRDQKMREDALELDLQRIVKQLEGAGTQTQDFCKSHKCSQPQSRFSSPSPWYINF